MVEKDLAGVLFREGERLAADGDFGPSEQALHDEADMPVDHLVGGLAVALPLPAVDAGALLLFLAAKAFPRDTVALFDGAGVARAGHAPFPARGLSVLAENFELVFIRRAKVFNVEIDHASPVRDCRVSGWAATARHGSGPLCAELDYGEVISSDATS